MNFIKNILDKIPYLINLSFLFDKNLIQIHLSIFNFHNHFFIEWRKNIKKCKEYTIFKIHKNFGGIILSFSKDLYTGIRLDTALIENNKLGIRFYFAILGLQLFIILFIKFLHILYFILFIILIYCICWLYNCLCII